MLLSKASIDLFRPVVRRHGSPARLLIGLAALSIVAPSLTRSSVSAQERSDFITASFANKHSVAPDEQIDLVLSHALNETEGRLTVFISTTDVTSLFTSEKQKLRYNAKLWPLPLGE